MEKKQFKKKIRKLVPFDDLKLLTKTEDGSGWQGEKGYYYFKPTNKVGPREPVRQVYLNRKYLTGLFDTKKKDVYFGDIKLPDGKEYLHFQILGGGNIKIYLKK